MLRLRLHPEAVRCAPLATLTTLCSTSLGGAEVSRRTTALLIPGRKSFMSISTSHAGGQTSSKEAAKLNVIAGLAGSFKYLRAALHCGIYRFQRNTIARLDSHYHLYFRYLLRSILFRTISKRHNEIFNSPRDPHLPRSRRNPNRNH